MLVRLLRRVFLGGGGGRDSGFSFGLLLLAYHLLARIGITKIPKVTGAAIALQVAMFLRWIQLDGSISDACLSANALLHGSSEYRRLITAPLTHASDIHLYYNMVSLAWKGIRLEQEYGSVKFLLVLAAFGVSSGIVYVLLALVAADVIEDGSYRSQCVVGFSSVLFGLKVLVHRMDSGRRRWEDFGFFTLPKNLAVWAELLIIQLLVPNASFLGHLAGILTGLVYCNIDLPFRIVSAPFKTSFPATLTLASAFGLLHFDVVEKPWMTERFWSSKSSLVCLSAKKVVDDRQWIRLLSAPLEHHGSVHFLTCLGSFVLKGRFLESLAHRRRSYPRSVALTLAATVATSLAYVAVSWTADDLINPENASECAQGLSGLLFALKVVTFYELRMAERRSYSLLAFELAESLMLLEKSTFLFHLSGLLVGMAYCALSWRKLFVSTYPGRGHRLGGKPMRSRVEYGATLTRSWGYAGQEGRFRDGGDRPRDEGVAAAASGGSTTVADCFEGQADEESDSSAGVDETQLPEATPSTSRPPPKIYFSSLSHPPPPPSGGAEFFSEDEDDLDGILDQVDRSPTAYVQ